MKHDLMIAGIGALVGAAAGGSLMYFRCRIAGAAKVLFGKFEAVAAADAAKLKADALAEIAKLKGSASAAPATSEPAATAPAAGAPQS